MLASVLHFCSGKPLQNLSGVDSAFFPQFISADTHAGAQIVLLSITFFCIAVLVDGSWALLAGRLRWLLAARGKLRNRLSGGMLIGAAGALALARRGQ